MPEGAVSAVEKQPLPLTFGLYWGLVTTLVFLNAYKLLGETTTRGWLATLSASFELSGVVLVASPELRPIVERLAAEAASMLRHLARVTLTRLMRLLRLPIRHSGLLSSDIGFGADGAARVIRGQIAPSPSATIEENVAFLLEEVERIGSLVERLENQFREEIGGVRKDLEQTAAELRKHTAVAVREVAETELRMRLVGVGFVMAGIALAYAASLA
jgi:hypothetical protein